MNNQKNNIKRSDLLIAVSVLAFAFAFVGCNNGADPVEAAQKDDNAVSFNVYASSATTKGVAVASSEITGTDKGIGVFAFYQPAVSGTKVYFNTRKFVTPDFMYNQQVKSSDNGTNWSYTPIKYWPNNTGDQLSFFAYAPYKAATTWDDLGIATDATASKITASFPIYNEKAAMQDILWTDPQLNKTKASTTAGATDNPISFNFRHLLSKIALQVGVETNKAAGTPGTWTYAGTTITIDKVEFTNLADEYKYSCPVDASGAMSTGGSYWAAGSAIQNIVLTRENGDFAADSSEISNKEPWNSTEAYHTLLSKENSNPAFLFLAPQTFTSGKEQVIITYTVETVDDNDKANCSTITNVIATDLSTILSDGFESGNAYTLKFLLGMNSVKFSVDVTDWEEPLAETVYNVAFIKETGKAYAALARAFSDVQEGETIELLRNCSIDASISVDKNATLELKDYTLTSNVSGDYLFKVASGKSFTLENGSVADGTEGAATGLIQPTAATVVVSNVNFGTFNTTGETNILFPMTGSTSLTLTDVTVTTNNHVVETSGESNTLVVTNGTYTDTKRNDATHTFNLQDYDTSSALFEGVTITSPDAAVRQSCIQTGATKGSTSNIVLKNCTIKAEYGSTVYAAADMTIINCDIETADNADNAFHAVTVEGEHTLNIYGGTYKGSTKANSAALRIWTSGGTIKVYDKYNGETLPVVIEGTYMFFIDSNSQGQSANTAEIYFEGDSIQTKGQWEQRHVATAYVKGGYHDYTSDTNNNPAYIILSGGTYTKDPRTDNYTIADGYTVVKNEGTPETWSVKPGVALVSMDKTDENW